MFGVSFVCVAGSFALGVLTWFTERFTGEKGGPGVSRGNGLVFQTKQNKETV